MELVKAGARVTLGVAAVLAALTLLYFIRPVLVLLLISILFAQAISPLVLAMRRTGARRAQAVLAIYLLILAALVGLGWMIWAAVSSQVATLVQSVPEMQRQLSAAAQAIPFASAREAAQRALSSPLPTIQGDVVPKLVQTVGALLESLFAIFSVFVITFYWISERLQIRRSLLRLLPEGHREQGLTVWEDVEDKLGAWVRGQLLVMLCIGVAFAAGLGLMGVKFWLVLALFAALAEIVPIAGPYIGTLPAVLIALTQSFQLAVIVALYGIAVQLIENNVLVPRILGHTTGVSPLTVLVGILIGATLMGILGALLAVPIAAAIQVLIADLSASEDQEEAPAKPAHPPAVRSREAVAAR